MSQLHKCNWVIGVGIGVWGRDESQWLCSKCAELLVGEALDCLITDFS